jgi:hypothetical protein
MITGYVDVYAMVPDTLSTCCLREVPVRVDKHNDQYNDYNVTGCPRFVHVKFLAKIILIVFTAEMGLQG